MRKPLWISIHAPREGGDAGRRGDPCALSDFNPRPPRGGRHRYQVLTMAGAVFQSTPPARGATSTPTWEIRGLRFQSTPPARGATGGWLRRRRRQQISIHAPREGGDDADMSGASTILQFQSTPPARGATLTGSSARLVTTNFNPRPPRGGRHLLSGKPGAGQRHFNPRPPRGGRRGRPAALHLR